MDKQTMAYITLRAISLMEEDLVSRGFSEDEAEEMVFISLKISEDDFYDIVVASQG